MTVSAALRGKQLISAVSNNRASDGISKTALAPIVASFCTNPVGTIQTHTTAKAAWKKQYEWYDGTAMTNKQHVLHSLLKMRCSSDKRPGDHVSKL